MTAGASGHSVGFDGSNPNADLIDSSNAIPLAMTVSGEYLYWQANASPVRIGRSRLDGTEVQSRRGHDSPTLT